MIVTCDVWIKTFRMHYGTGYFTNSELANIYSAMYKAEQEFPDSGWCNERACRIRSLLGIGSVATFSYAGFSVTDRKSYIVDTYIAIPYSQGYNSSETIWAYHTVFEYNNFIFTYELNMPVYIKDYRKKLDELTRKYHGVSDNEKRNTRSRYYIPMKYEKQLGVRRW